MLTDTPICVVKNGISHPIENYQKLDRPFSFVLPDGKRFRVEKDELPVYFARKRAFMRGGKSIHVYVHRFCVGSLKANGKQDVHWIHRDGSYDEPCEEKLRMAS